MTLQQFVKRTEKLVTDNSPTILTVIGVAGTLSTAYFSGTASFKASEVIRQEQRHIDLNGSPRLLTKREKAEMVWKLYIPAASMGVLTVTAIIFANRIGMRRAAAMAAAYTVSERAFFEYKDKVVDTIGKNKEEAIRAKISEDRVRNDPPRDKSIVIGTGEVLCRDGFSGRYLTSSMDMLKRAEIEINFQILHYDSATVSDFYDKIKLSHTSVSDELGWNTDKKLELHFDTVLTEDGRPCLTFDFASVPIRHPWKFS